MPKMDKQRRMAKPHISFISKKTKKSNNIHLIKEKINVYSNNTSIDINDEEYNMILSYRKNLIFQTPEDFIESIKNIENKNLKMFEKTDNLFSDIQRLKQKYNELLNNKDYIESSFVFLIKKKQNELQIYKNNFAEKTKFITDYQSSNNNTNDINDDSDLFDKKIILNQNKSKLMYYVEKLFSTSNKIVIGKDIYNFKNQDNIIGANKSSEELILDMLELIEVRISYLLTQFLMYKNPMNSNFEYIRKLRLNFTKKRNLENAQITKIDNQKKNLKQLEEIKAKHNHILFLNKNKKDIKNYLIRLNTEKTSKRIKKIKKYIPKIEDFLSTDNIDINNNNTRYYDE